MGPRLPQSLLWEVGIIKHTQSYHWYSGTSVTVGVIPGLTVSGGYVSVTKGLLRCGAGVPSLTTMTLSQQWSVTQVTREGVLSWDLNLTLFSLSHMHNKKSPQQNISEGIVQVWNLSHRLNLPKNCHCDIWHLPMQHLSRGQIQIS